MDLERFKAILNTDTAIAASQETIQKIDDQSLRAALQRAYEQAVCRSPSVFVATYYETINEFRQKGLTFDLIAKAIETLGTTIKAATLRKLFAREQKKRNERQNLLRSKHEGARKARYADF
jgi:hypothetical protein